MTSFSHPGQRPTTRLAIFGAGGHGRELANLAMRCGYVADELLFLVDEGYGESDVVAGINVSTLGQKDLSGLHFIAAIGDPGARAAVVARCTAAGMHALTLVDPSVPLSSSVSMGVGCAVTAGCVLTVDVTLGNHVHINVGCTVSHDTRIGDFSTLSPGVHLAGRIHVGERVFIGIGASIINGTDGHPLLIGADAVIGAGACVTRGVDPGMTVVGVPARPVRR